MQEKQACSIQTKLIYFNAFYSLYGYLVFIQSRNFNTQIFTIAPSAML